MGKRLSGVLMAALLVLLMAGCSRGKVIPRSTMACIYADMFLADQWLFDHPEYRTHADTVLFYEPIMQRYGYSFKDFDASVNYYIDDPEKYSKIFRQAATILNGKKLEFKSEQERLMKIREFNSSIKGYSRKRFPTDSLLWRSPDSLLHDSLIRDSILRDSLLRDSIRTDSLRRDSLRIDSLQRVHAKKLAAGAMKKVKVKEKTIK